jgi:hypothetical protein
MSRRLRLSAERLTDLTPDELSTLAGGGAIEQTPLCVRLPTNWYLCAAVDEVLETRISCSGC